MNLYLLEEKRLDPETTKHYEGAFTQGSGYVHIRGSFEEGLAAAPQDEDYMRLPANVTVEKPRHPRSKCGTYVPGVTGKHPLLGEELVNLPNPLWFRPAESGERLDMDECQITEYSRILDMKTGHLTRRFVWHAQSGARLHCVYERFVSMSRRNRIVQRISYRALETGARLMLFSTIDERVRTNGYNHFAKVEKRETDGRTAVAVTTDTGDRVTLTGSLSCDRGSFHAENGMQTLAVELAPNDGVTVIRETVIGTSRDTLTETFESPPLDYRELFAESAASWEALWRQAEVRIEGDDKAQAAVNFSIYHLLRSASRDDDRIAVCAKGFAGEAYFGHFFWDTEMYLLPFFLYNFPDTAKNLVSFRIRTLDGAMQNARKAGYAGAKYAWESSVSGAEQCPNWQYADHEIHVTADVVFGMWHYYRATGDEAFLLRAAPVFAETARFWLDRVYTEADGSVSLNGVMGPDEYVCMCNNNAYTNEMVRYALERTLDVMRIVGGRSPDAYRALALEKGFERRLETVVHALRKPVWKDGVMRQFDGFDRLEEPDFATLWPDRSRHFGACVSQERNYRTKALKQADVLMLPYLFPSRFTRAQTQSNMAYYLPYTTHDSSLSAIVHAIVLAGIGRDAEAYAFFDKALDIDMSQEGGGAAEGIHIANCGGIWQAVIAGFAGMRFSYETEEPSFSPRLPEHWKKLSFRLRIRGRAYDVVIQGKDVCLTRKDLQ